MIQKRNHYTPEQKIRILKEHLSKHKPISDICDRYQISPTTFSPWQRQFFEQGNQAFQNQLDLRTRKLEITICGLEQKLSQKNDVLSELMKASVSLKKILGSFDRGVPPDTRDQVVDFVRDGLLRTEIPISRFVSWPRISPSKFYRWKQQSGKINEHNYWIPRDFWLPARAGCCRINKHHEKVSFRIPPQWVRNLFRACWK